jgi:two-component sensor histidine kinase
MSEQDRLAALAATGLLDSQADPRFDRLTRLAANSLETQTAIVSLVDSDRQWFKARHCLDVEQTDRDVSFCAHAIKQAEVMVVLDATKDPRFTDNPLVTSEPHIRFYAGAPLVTADGHALGTLCVIDYKPRKVFDSTDAEILRDLAASVIELIEDEENAREVNELSVINRELQHRMGNMYAHVSSLISLLDKADLEHDDYVRRLREKVNALAVAQTLLASSKREAVSLHELATRSLEVFQSGAGDSAVIVQKDHDFEITPRAAFAMTLMLHELGVNSVKHGALGTHGGTANFGWTTGEEITFNWKETISEARPKSSEKASGGFGSVILRRITPKTFGGEANSIIETSSYHYTVTANPDHILAD